MIDKINQKIFLMWAYVISDYKAWPFRFAVETYAWVSSVGCAIIMAITLPNVPFLFIYPLWMINCAIFGWGAWTRGSTGMTANCLLMICIDMVGYIRFLMR